MTILYNFSYITGGTTGDYAQTSKLIEKISAEHLLADKGYDSDEIIKQAENDGIPNILASILASRAWFTACPATQMDSHV